MDLVKILAIVILAYFGIRMIVWMVLQRKLQEFSKIARKCRQILAIHGSTVGALRKAGKEKLVDQLEECGGQLYEEMVPLTAFLFGWYFFGKLFHPRIRRAVERSGYLRAEQEGAYTIAREVTSGILEHHRYFPPSRLRGIELAIREAKLFIFF